MLVQGQQYSNGRVSASYLRTRWVQETPYQISGADVISGNPDFCLPALLFVLALFLFSVNSWAACSESTGSQSSVTLQSSCSYGTNIGYGCTGTKNYGSPLSGCGKCITPYVCRDNAVLVVTGSSYRCSGSSQFVDYTYKIISCDSQAEADSVRCVLYPDDPGCEDGCENDRKVCESMGGKFSGSDASGCCIGTCDECSAIKKVVAKKRALCCAKGMAPPDTIIACMVEARQTCGVNVSTFKSKDNEFECQDPSLDSTTYRRYASECFEQDSTENGGSGSSGSGDGSSSSGEGVSGTSSPYPEGCDECPWLDSILDTLIKQKDLVEDIHFCVTFPSMCSDDGSEQVSIDSSILKLIVPWLDSSVKLDSHQVKLLMKLDTNFLKSLRNDSNLFKLDSMKLKNDTSTRMSIVGGFSKLDSTTDALNDSTRKWMRRIADSIGVTTDSLAAHLDSILSHIPDSILDSILKYQKTSMDNYDSVFFGPGRGFSLIDSLVDSTVKYFRVSNHYDSTYIKMFHDYDSTFKYKMEHLDVGLDLENMGYGDTATSNLRVDLLSVREAIRDMDSSVSAGMSDIRGLLEGMALDGDWTGAFDSAIAANGGGAVDTSGVYLDIYGGELLADSIARDVGYDKIDVVRDTAFMDSVLALDYTETDSTLCVGSECVSYDSDAKIADSAQRYIARQGDSIRASNQAFYSDSVDSYFQQVKDTLTKWNPFGMFDSTLMKTLGAKVPNSNTCPEHCSKYSVEVPFIFGNLGIDLDWQLCASWAVLGGQNVMSFLRFIIRVIVAVTCIAMVMHAAANTKVK